MDERQILILLQIGSIDVSQKCVESVSVDRNFSDVGDKFSITIVDTPDTTISYDLELYMASGYRNITLKYGDLSANKLVAFNGTIWDYTNTFVGNIKKLTVTGIMNRYIESANGVSNRTYNIDWNSYYNRRTNETYPYAAMSALIRNRELTDQLKVTTQLSYTKDEGLSTTAVSNKLSSAILDAQYRNYINGQFNTQTLDIISTNGKDKIMLPVPDCFFHTDVLPSEITAESIENIDRKKYEAFYDFINDPQNKYWGKLTMTKSTEEAAVVDYLSIPLATGFVNTFFNYFY